MENTDKDVTAERIRSRTSAQEGCLERRTGSSYTFLYAAEDPRIPGLTNSMMA